MEEKTINEEEMKEQFRLKFAKALESMPLDNIVLKKSTKYKNFSKDDVNSFLENPITYQNQLRQVVEYLIISSPQFNLLCNYLPSMALFNYSLYPNISKFDIENLDVGKVKKEYIKVAQYLEMMNLKQEFKKAITHNFYFDTFYGYEVESDKKSINSYFIKTLNPQYCRICGSEDGCYLIEFDFSYFNGANEKLVYGDDFGRVAYPEEFKEKYETYKTDKRKFQWQQLEKGICTKYNEAFTEYSIPPYIGLFDDLVDIEDFKSLNKASVESDNYKLIALQIPLNDGKDAKEDDFLLSMDIIQMYMSMLQDQIPEGVGFFATPMKPSEMTFKKDNMSTKNNVQDAIQNLFDSTGFSKLLFGGATDSTSLSYSVKTDEQKLFGLYRQFERIVNRKLKNKFGGKFLINILNMSEFSKKETVELLIQTTQASVPTKTKLVASLGMTPLEQMGAEILENKILELHKNWIPPQSSYTQSGDGGRPEMDDSEISPSGLQTRKDNGNARVKE